MSQNNLIGATGYRFISKGKTAFKIHIHTPDDTVLHRSVGFVRMGEDKALKKTIKLRDELGRQLWGKFWPKVLKEPYLMTRLPHSLEPKIVFKPNPTQSDPGHRDECYIAKWRVFSENGDYKYRTKVCSIRKHGRLAAYSQTKRALLEAHKDVIELLIFMGRLNSIDLK